jgi:hypothetical protein
MKKLWSVLFVVMALAIISAPEAEAQVVVGQTHMVIDAPVYGIPAQPGPIPNGTIRHDYNSYVGVDTRHYSRLPMRWGTGPVRATGPIVGPPCGPRPVPYYGGAYIARRPFGGGFVTGGAVVYPVGAGGSSGYISFGGTIGW